MAQACVKNYTGIITTGTQTVLPAPGGGPFATYAISVKGVAAAATSWTAVLEGSLDGLNWTAVLTHNATDGSTAWETTGKPCLFVRLNVTALSLGSATSVGVIVVAVP